MLNRLTSNAVTGRDMSRWLVKRPAEHRKCCVGEKDWDWVTIKKESFYPMSRRLEKFVVVWSEPSTHGITGLEHLVPLRISKAFPGDAQDLFKALGTPRIPLRT